MRDNHETFTSADMKEMLAEMKRRPEAPIPAIAEDSAVIQGLIDLLIVKGIIQDKDPDRLIIGYAERYNSLVTGLVMLLVEKGIITDQEMDAAILAFHSAIRHFGDRPGTTFEDVSTLRRNTLRQRLGR